MGHIQLLTCFVGWGQRDVVQRRDIQPVSIGIHIEHGDLCMWGETVIGAGGGRAVVTLADGGTSTPEGGVDRKEGGQEEGRTGEEVNHTQAV